MSRIPMFLGAAAAAALAALPAQASMNISSAPTKNVVCSAGTCSPTAKGAILNVTDLQNLLASSDVTVNTGSGAVTIEITAPLSWASTHRLTLNANFNVSVKALVAVEGTSGLTVNYAGGGELLFFPGGKIDFWDTASSLSVNGASYVLVNDLATLASDIAANSSGLYALAKDYDAGPDGTYQNGVSNIGFGGLLEGLGHTISNLAIQGGSGVSAVGMFEQTTDGIVIRDLNLANVNIQAQGGSVGAFVGQGGVNFVNVSSSGSISGGTEIGGLIGRSQIGGNVTRSHSSATVDGSFGDTVGGLVGSGSGNIFYSYGTGHVTGGPKSAVGGLVGSLEGQVIQSYSTATIDSHGSATIGGLVGGLVSDSTVTDSYSMGQVTAGHFSTMGGMIGNIRGSVSRSYSTTAVIYKSHAPQKTRIGGFAGRYLSGTLDSDYWDVDTSGQSKACASGCHTVTGLSDAALKAGLPSGFDPAVWAQSASINNGYPYLIANPPQ